MGLGWADGEGVYLFWFAVGGRKGYRKNEEREIPDCKISP